MAGTPLHKASDNLRFSAAVAGFGMLLRKSKHAGNSNYQGILELAKGAKGSDKEGYRAEFFELVKMAQQLAP